jgi:hypothetical protein
MPQGCPAIFCISIARARAALSIEHLKRLKHAA